MHIQWRNVSLGVHEAVKLVHTVQVVAVSHRTKPGVPTGCQLRELLNEPTQSSASQVATWWSGP